MNTKLQDYVDCKICGRDLRSLGYHLISRHEITPEEYRAEYPEAELVSETVRAVIAKCKMRKRPLLPHWEKVWTPEYVLDRMAELHRRKFPMNAFWATTHEQPLAGKAILYFGSWDAALRGIGLNPEQIRLATPTENLTAIDVARRLKQRRKEGRALNSAAVQEEDVPLANAIRKYFGTHDRALIAARFDPKQIYRLRRHTDREVAALYRDARRVAGLRGEAHRRSWLRFLRKYSRMVEERRFGGWKKVAASIGVPVERLIWKRFRKRQDVMAALRNRVRQGKSIEGERVLEEDMSLRTAVFKYLGGFSEVYREFGMRSPRESRWCRANKSEIVTELRRRDATGEPVTWREILPTQSGPAFLERAKKLFGSWSGALAAAGLDPFGGARRPRGHANMGSSRVESRRLKRAVK